MKCQTLLSRNIKKNIISLSSAEFAHSMVNVNTICERKLIQDFCCFFFTAVVSLNAFSSFLAPKTGLTLIAPITTAADDILIVFCCCFFVCFFFLFIVFFFVVFFFLLFFFFLYFFFFFFFCLFFFFKEKNESWHFMRFTSCGYNVVTTSLQRNDVVATLYRRWCYFACLLGGYCRYWSSLFW